VVDFHTALSHDLFEIAVGNGIAKVEKHGVHDYSFRVMHTLEIDHPENPYLQPPDNAASFHVEPKQESLRHSQTLGRPPALSGERQDLVRQRLANGKRRLAPTFPFTA